MWKERGDKRGSGRGGKMEGVTPFTILPFDMFLEASRLSFPWVTVPVILCAHFPVEFTGKLSMCQRTCLTTTFNIQYSESLLISFYFF